MRNSILRILMLALAVMALSAQVVLADQVLTRDNLNRTLGKDQFKKKLIVEKMDKEHMIDKTKAITIDTPDMLKIPAICGDIGDVKVAKTVSPIDFLVVPENPRFFFETPRGDGGLWVDWGQGTYHDGKYYGSIGNHVFYDSRLHVMEYNPKSMTLKMSPELNTLCGLPIEYGDGKIHGELDFFGSDTMYFTSYWTQYPPTEKDWATGYQGGRVMSYNFKTGKFVDYGVPIKRVSYPYNRADHKRGLLYCVGSSGEFMVWDVKQKKMLYGGFPPPGMVWYSRDVTVDEETGCAYTGNTDKSDPDIHILKYDSNKNTFSLMKSTVVKTPGSKATEADCIRANTPRKLKDGSFIMMTRSGHMFKFFPELDKTEDLGMNWPAPPEKLYTTTIAMSPNGKYIYYIPGGHGGSQALGAPIVQYNTETKERKVIDFLYPYFHDRFGYVTGGCYSLDMDETGSRLFIWMNGAFSEWSETTWGETMGDVSVMVVHIPESERL